MNTLQRGSQIPDARSPGRLNLYRDAKNLLALSIELASCHFLAPRILSSRLDFCQLCVHPSGNDYAGAIIGGDFEEVSNYQLLKDSVLWNVS